MSNLEDKLEEAFWDFDGRRKGYGKWKNRPQAERDAFKSILRKFISLESQFGEQVSFTSVNKPIPPLGRILGEGDTEFCSQCGSGIIRKFQVGPVLGCHQPECSNFYKHKT